MSHPYHGERPLERFLTVRFGRAFPVSLREAYHFLMNAYPCMRFGLAAALLTIAAARLPAQTETAALEQGFKAPPESAKPRTW